MSVLTVPSSTGVLYTPPVPGGWTFFLSLTDSPQQVHFSRGFLDSGAKRTPNEWDYYSLESYRKGGPYNLSAPDFTRVLRRAYELSRDPRNTEVIEDLRKNIRDFARDNYSQLASRLLVKPRGRGPDRVVHHKGLPIESSFELDFEDREQLTKLFFGADSSEILKLYSWLNGGTCSPLDGPNRPDFEYEYVAELFMNSYMCGLTSIGSPQASTPALGGFVV